MNLQTLRDQVKGILGDVDGISEANVLDVEAWSEDPNWFRDHFVEPSGRACGWWIEMRPLAQGEFLGHHRELVEITLRGVLGYSADDGSRAEAEQMLQGVLEQLRKPSNRRLGGLVNFTDPPSRVAPVRPFWAESGEDRFLCHFMEVVFTAQVDVAYV